uniref:Uncharacterized protein n=1 Tax=Arundo donax TaxID=35708 RepID=A0A0A9HD99_ARUDO
MFLLFFLTLLHYNVLPKGSLHVIYEYLIYFLPCI